MNYRLRPGIIRTVLILGISLFLLAVSPLKTPAEDEVTMTVKAGFSGYVRSGEILPLKIKVENNGADFNGKLQITTTLNNETGLTNYKEVFVSSGSEKLFDMYMPRSYGGQDYTIRLISGENPIAESKIKVTYLPANELIIGVLAADPATLKHLEAIRLPGEGQRVKVIQLGPDDIPKNSMLLETLDGLVLNNFNSQLLADGQMESIYGWVERGGLLVVAGGANWHRTMASLPSEFLPCRVTGSKIVDGLSSLEELTGEKLASGFVISEGEVKGGEVILSQEDTPIIARGSLGRGSTVYLAFDLAMPPFTTYAGNEGLWWHILSGTDPHSIISAGNFRVEMMHRPNEMTWMLRNIPANDLPSGAALGLVLLLYILVLGPGTYLLLKKFDRRDWGWIAIPAMAVILFSVTYLTGFKTKGRDTYTNTISVVRMDPDCDFARVTSFIGVFAPTKRVLNLESGPDKIVEVMSSDNYWQYPSRRVNVDDKLPELATVLQGGDRTTVEFNDFSRWSMRSIRVEDTILKPGQITSDLTTEAGRIFGTLTNNTPYLLSDCVIFSKMGYQKIPKILPGETIDINFAPIVSTRNTGPIFYRIYESYPVNRPQGYRYVQNRDTVVSRQVMETLSYSEESLAGNLVFIGRTSEILEDLGIRDLNGRNYHNTVLIARQDLKLENKGKVSVPPGIVNARVVSFNNQRFNRDLHGYSMGEGLYEYQLDIPVSLKDLHIDKLQLYTVGDNRSLRYSTGLSVFNWEKQSYETIAYQPNGMVLKEPERYISDTGAIRIRIEVGKDYYLFLSSITAALEGSYQS
ncbi:MAG: hypothetical protein ACOXZ5_03765 [Syntrophomonadaceae bacterium]